MLEAMADNDSVAIADVVDDLLFAAINLIRHLKVDPEAVLFGASANFERRFRFIEQALRGMHQSVESCTLEALDSL